MHMNVGVAFAVVLCWLCCALVLLASFARAVGSLKKSGRCSVREPEGESPSGHRCANEQKAETAGAAAGASEQSESHGRAWMVVL